MADEDHSRVGVKNVNLQNSWLRGAQNASRLLRAHDLFPEEDVDWARLDAAGVDMFKPYGGSFVGLGTAADDDDGEVDAREATEVDADLDVGEGARQVEEAIAEGAPALERQYRTVLGDDGGTVGLDRACRETRRGIDRKSTERNGRVAGAPKVPVKFSTPGSASGDVVRVLDPLLAFVETSQGMTLVVGIAEQFKKADGATGVAFVHTGELLDKGTVVKLRILRMKTIIESPGMAFFPVASVISTVEVKGSACHAVNPDVVLLGGAAHLEFSIDVLVPSARIWWDESTLTPQGPHKLVLCTVRSENAPYKGSDGLPLFIATGTESSAPAGSGGGGGGGRVGSAAATVTCVICGQDWRPDAMRQHMGFHLLHERSKVPAMYPCGFCGGESAQFSSDPAQLSGCAVWFHNAQPKMLCKLVGDVKYSIGSAAKSSKATPCTNRPLLCPQCPAKPGVAHWKLNMPSHWQNAHSSGMPFPPAFAEQLETTAQEAEWTRIVGGERRKIPWDMSGRMC